ncbi:MAG TPA: hypothetical protein VF210_20895 [Pseudomonadales bacterium]
MSGATLRRGVASITFRALYWARWQVAPGIRSLLGLLLMVAGVLGFLPVLGFWMFPLGVAFVALDLPFSRQRIELWMLRLAREADLSVDPAKPWERPAKQCGRPADLWERPPAANSDAIPPAPGRDQPTSNQ